MPCSNVAIRTLLIAGLLLSAIVARAQDGSAGASRRAEAEAEATSRDSDRGMENLRPETRATAKGISEESKKRAEAPDPRTKTAIDYIAGQAKRRALSQTENPLDPKQRLVPGKPAAKAPSITLQVLATESILEDTVDKLLVEASRLHAAYPDRDITVRALLKGLPAGAHNMRDAVMKLRAISEAIAKAAPPVSVAVSIDPRPFRTHHSNAVPHSILDVENKPTVTVSGAVVGMWLMDQFTRGSKGHLGTIGPTVEVVERDLREVIDERLSRIDWASKRDKAMSQYWGRQTKASVALPTAAKRRVREYDPTIEVTEDMRTPAGLLIARKGQKLNPLEIKPYGKALIVFDPLAPGQIETARQLGAHHERAVKYLVTRLVLPSGETGAKALAKLEQVLAGRVYRFDARQFGAFQLEALPSVIEQFGKVWRVTEHSLVTENLVSEGSFPAR